MRARGATALMSWLFSLWLLGLVIHFSDIALHAIQNPFNPGADVFWAVAWLRFAILLVLAYAILPARLVTAGWFTISSLIALVVSASSGALVPFVLALWIILVSIGVGVLILRRIVREETSFSEDIAYGVTLGFASLALVMFCLGTTWLLRAPVIWLVLAATTVVAAPSLKRLAAAGVRRWKATRVGIETGLLLSLMLATALLHLTWAVAPEIQYDALNYHLAVPQLWLKHGGLVDPQFLHGYLARLVEVLLAACLAVGGPQTAKLWIFGMSICTAIAVYALGTMVVNARVGTWAAAFFSLTPLVGWLSGTVYVDNVIAMFVTAAVMACIRWQASTDEGWLITFGLLAGTAVGSKPNAVFALAAAGPVALWKALPRLKVVARATVAFAMVAAPTYLLIHSFTGNPVFPLFNSIFRSPKWAAKSMMPTGAASAGFLGFLELPFRLTFDTLAFSEVPGSLGVSLLLALPFSLLLVRRARPALNLLVGSVLAYVLLFFFTIQYARYFLPILPIVAVLGAATALSWAPPRSRVFVVLLFTILVMQPVVAPVLFWNIPERYPIRLALGREPREAFLARALPGYTAVVRVNAVAEPDDKVIGLEAENLRFYLEPTLETTELALQGSPLKRAVRLDSDVEVARLLESHGYEWLLAKQAALTTPGQRLPYSTPSFLEKHAIVEFRDADASVYRLRDRAPR